MDFQKVSLFFDEILAGFRKKPFQICIFFYGSGSFSHGYLIGCLKFTQKSGKFRMECKWQKKFCLSERKFSLENGISSKVDQNSQTEYPNGKCAFHLLVFQAFWLGLLLILSSEKNS